MGVLGVCSFITLTIFAWSTLPFATRSRLARWFWTGLVLAAFAGLVLR